MAFFRVSSGGTVGSVSIYFTSASDAGNVRWYLTYIDSDGNSHACDGNGSRVGDSQGRTWTTDLSQFE